jgi:heme exporter protein A
MPQTTIYVSPRSFGAPDSRPPAVVTEDLARLYAGNPALAGISLRVEAGRSVALFGPNGAGKTTLLRILSTAVHPSFGRAKVDGLDVAAHADAVRARVAYLGHATGLYDDLTVRENLRFSAALLETPEAEARVGRALSDMGLAEQADRRAHELSAGLRRRAGLARLLLGQPSLILLDEPYAALDAEAITLVDRLLDAWRDAGVSVLVASHATERLTAAVDGVVRLERGLVTAVAGEGVIAQAPLGVPGGRPAVAGAPR